MALNLCFQEMERKWALSDSCFENFLSFINQANMASEMKIFIFPSCDCAALFKHFEKKKPQTNSKCSQSCREGNRDTERLSDLLKVTVVCRWE